jgi:ABC-type multidrug transport system fused ATPase/permease subunit
VLRNTVLSDLAKPIPFLTRAARQGRNYSSVIIWLLYRACRGSAYKLTIAVALSLAHLACQGAAIFAIYWYGRRMEKAGDVTLPVLKIAVNFRDQPEWLWLVVIFSTVCFVMSAGFLYLSRRVIYDAVERHFARKIEELMLLFARLPDPRARLASDLLRESERKLNFGCRRAAIIGISFYNAALSAVGGIGAAIFLFWIDYSLTLLIFIGIALAALLLYPLTLRAVGCAKGQEKAQAAFRVEVRELYERNSVERKAGLETADKVARAFMMRRRILTELVFASEIGITVILGLVVYYMASQALAGKEQWGIFIAYIASLRMALNGVAQPIRSFASISRFYPQFVRYYLFIKDTQTIEATPFGKVQRGDTVVLGSLPNGEDVVAKAGDRLAVATFEPLRELQYALLNARVRHVTAPLAATIANCKIGVEAGAAIAIVDSNELESGVELQRFADALKDKVTLIVYRHAAKVGAFGELRVLTLFEGALKRCALLGSEEGAAALKEFSLKLSAKQSRRTGAIYDEDDEDDDDDI